MSHSRNAAYVSRFHLLLPLPRIYLSSAAVPAVFVPSHPSHKRALKRTSAAAAALAREQFQEGFGPSSGSLIMGGWKILWTDGLFEQGGVRKSTKQFIEELDTKGQRMISSTPEEKLNRVS